MANNKTLTEKLGMSPKLLRFCQEYIKDCNGTQAAIRAGYKPHAAYAQANRILKRPDVQKWLQDQYMEHGPNITLIVEELFRVAMSESDGKTVKAADKVAAMDKLLRISGAYKDRTEVAGSIDLQPVLNLSLSDISKKAAPQLTYEYEDAVEFEVLEPDTVSQEKDKKE